ncbi:MAG TPA: hypothetical protein VE223_07595 [Nitrososphaeraceae archaeon]|nr:hypothetical protein [Nitrososphaeraceae archaeon]
MKVLKAMMERGKAGRAEKISSNAPLFQLIPRKALPPPIPVKWFCVV